MAITVFCRKLQKEADGLDFQLYSGELGKRIFDNISKEAWAEWQKKQSMLFNEQQWIMIEPNARKFLEEKMSAYLFDDVEPTIEGYVPPEK